LKRSATKTPPPAQVRIQRVGADGDGIGVLPDDRPLPGGVPMPAGMAAPDGVAASGHTPIYLPFTLPGELVTADPTRRRAEGWLARVLSIDEPSSARIEPPCAYFGQCGGCALQHWLDADYARWKCGLLTAALQRAGFAAAEAVRWVSGLPGERRRLDFAVRRDRGHTIFGLHAAGSGEVVDLAHCLVLHPVLIALTAPLRTVLQAMQAVRKEASVVINLLQSGPDVLLRTDAALTLADRTALIALARAHGVPRVSWALGNARPETVCVFRPPAALMSGVEVRPPPGVFMQATAAGERAIVDAVLKGLPARMTGRARVAELYAGCGTLTFALAGKARVAAWEGDAASAAALKDAVNGAGLAGQIDVAQRDLTRQPLSAKELVGFPVVVLDPPHGGAAAQVAQIAAAGVASVVYVSCNPSALARDARALHAAGYRLAAATAIDQFLWSARIETVCVFRRP